MLGGPTMNLLIAVVLLTVIATRYGVPPRADAAVGRGQRSACCRRPRPTDADRVQPSDPKTPAARRGLQPGDRIVSVAGSPVDHAGTRSRDADPAAASARTCRSSSSGTGSG